MPEYIEKEAIKAAVRKRLNNSLIIRWLISIINEIPAAEVAPVVHGRLVLRAVSDVTSTFMCSECGREFEVANAYFRTPTNHPDKNYPYCNCGARMDGE